MRRAARVLAIFVAVLVAILLCLPLLIHANDFRPTIQARLSQALARDVQVGDLKLAIFSGGVTAADVSIADDPAFSKTPFLRAKSLNVGVDLLPLIFSHKINVTSLRIDQPEIVLLQTTAGKWNFSSLGTKPAAANPPAQPSNTTSGKLDLTVNLVRITNGRVSFQRLKANAKPRMLEKVNAELRDFSPTGVAPFSVSAAVAGGGDIDLRGKLGPLDAADTARTPGEATLTVKNLDLAQAGMADALTNLAGTASLEGKANSDGRHVHVEGKLHVEQLKLVKGASPARRAVELDFALDHDAQKLSGVLIRGDLHIGKAAATIAGNYDLTQEPLAIHMKITGPAIPVPELLAVLPALNIVPPAGSSIQGGVAHVNIAVDGPLGNLVSTGSLGIDNMRLAAFDLGAKMSTIERLAGIQRGPSTDIQTMRTNLKVTANGTNLDDMHLLVAGIGEITGAGTVSPSQVLDFKMRAMVHTSGALMTALGQRGDTGIPFVIQGTSANPVFRADMKGIAVDELKTVTGTDPKKAIDSLIHGLLGGKK